MTRALCTCGAYARPCTPDECRYRQLADAMMEEDVVDEQDHATGSRAAKPEWCRFECYRCGWKWEATAPTLHEAIRRASDHTCNGGPYRDH